MTACSLTAIVGGNTETATTVTVTITRGTLGQKSGNVTLEGSGDSWTITKMDRAVRGRDFQPLFTGTTFSLRIVGGDFAGAYQLGSASFQKTLTQAQLAQMFALPAGGKWLICGPDITTSTVTDTTAHYDGHCEWLDAASTPHLVAVSFDFVLEGTVWKVDRVTRKDS